jgi:hypothetical protein
LEYKFHIVDVFTATAFGGNQLAVLPQADGLSTTAMQTIAREFNFSETTFVSRVSSQEDCFDVRIFTPASELPFAGHPCGAKDLKSAKNDLDKIQSAYRFLLADLMPFGKNARITLEHGGENNSREHYETVTYWYGLPAPSLVKTDELAVGDAASEQAHAYQSPQASDRSAPGEVPPCRSRAG